jgi:polyhydroxyalkanoate synthesis regulator phasin
MTEGSIPVPDPSVLTTQALLREIGGLRELLSQRVESIEKAVEVAHNNLVRVPTDVDRTVGHLREVVHEKFNTVSERFDGIATQFAERDTRVEQTARAGEEALKAALQAAKELVGTQSASFSISIDKAEAATEKRFDAANDKIEDLKERLTLLEGQGRGKVDAVATRQASTFNVANVISVILGVLALLVATFVATRH